MLVYEAPEMRKLKVDNVLFCHLPGYNLKNVSFFIVKILLFFLLMNLTSV